MRSRLSAAAVESSVAGIGQQVRNERSFPSAWSRERQAAERSFFAMASSRAMSEAIGLASRIDSVAVYRVGALITRIAEVPVGTQRAKIGPLPVGIDDAS